MYRVGSLLIMIIIMISGCEEKYAYEGCKEAKVISYQELRENYPKIKEGQEIEKAAKIYNYKNGDILLINELNKGIHVVDNRVKTKVTKGDYFIELPGNVDIAVKDGYLYADSFTDLVVIDIRDMRDMKVVSRKEGIFAEDLYQAVRGEDLNDMCYHDGGFIVGYK